MLCNLIDQQVKKGVFGCAFQIDVKGDEPIFRIVDLAQRVGKLIEQRSFADTSFAMNHDAVVVEGRDNALQQLMPPKEHVLPPDWLPTDVRVVSTRHCIVDTASSGEAALSRAAEVPYDLAFVDLHMPAMDGRETVDRLRTTLSARGLPMPLIVILTADDAPPAGDQDWFDLFVSKPVSLPLLRASLDMLAEKTNQQATLFAAQPGSDRVDDFLETTRDSLERMKQALEIGDFDAIARAAHDVKGTGTSFGFRAMSVLGATLEEDARARSRSGVERGLLELEHSLSSV